MYRGPFPIARLLCMCACVCVRARVRLLKKGIKEVILAKKQPVRAMWCKRPGPSIVVVNSIRLAICSMVQFQHKYSDST